MARPCKNLVIYTTFTGSNDLPLVHALDLVYEDQASSPYVDSYEYVASGSEMGVSTASAAEMGTSNLLSEALSLGQETLTSDQITELNSTFNVGTAEQILDWFQAEYFTSGSDAKQLIKSHITSGSVISGSITDQVLRIYK